MTLKAEDVFYPLREWPHRAPGSEEELEAREMLITLLTAEPGVEISEEGFFGPSSYLPFLWTVTIGCTAALLASAFAPLFMAGVALLFAINHFLYFDWRVCPLIWLGAKTVCANLVASKGKGERLIILMAHLDSAPASFCYRPGVVDFFKESVFVTSIFVGLCVVIPLIEAQGTLVPIGVKLFVIAVILAQAILATIDRLRFGYSPGANDNLSGVSAATALASRLWRSVPANTEVRLILTSGEQAGLLGAQHYWRHHREELRFRDTHVLNFDSVGAGALGYVLRSGGFTPVRYEGQLAVAADKVAGQDDRFKDIRPAMHGIGDFGSVWFTRDGISSLTVAAYDETGHMPHIHTVEDTPDRVDLSLVERAVSFGEAIIDALPTPNP